MTIIAAALAMAACDTPVEEPGNEPDTSITYDVMSETGKGDDPYPTTDTTLDSDEGIDTGANSGATLDTAMDTFAFECTHPYPDGTRLYCIDVECTLRWGPDCRATCDDPVPNRQPWIGTATPAGVAEACEPM